MSRALRLVSLALLTALCLLANSGARAHAEPPLPAAASLLNATGLEYLAERDAALALPQAEFEPVLAHLLRPGASPKELVVGWALELRRTRPAAAAAFDADSADALANPNQGTRSGQPIYSGIKPESPDDNPLVFEWLLKRSDVPLEARWRFKLNVGQHSRVSPLTPVAALALLDEPNADRVFLLSAAFKQSGETLDPRVLDAALAEYRALRGISVAPVGGDSTMVAILSQRSDPEVAAAIQTLMGEERALAQAAGVEPWNDPNAAQAHRDAMAARSQAQRTARSAAVALAPEELAALDTQVEHALLRRRFREHWESLERAATRVGIARGQLSPVLGQPAADPARPAPVEITRSLNGAEVRVRFEYRPKDPDQGRDHPKLVVSKEVLQDGVPSWSQLLEVNEDVVSERLFPEPTQWWATSPRSLALELDTSRQLVIATAVVSYMGMSYVYVRLVPLGDEVPRPAGWREGQRFRGARGGIPNPEGLPADKAMLVRYSWKEADVLRLELLPSAEAEPATILLLDMVDVVMGPEPAPDPIGP